MTRNVYLYFEVGLIFFQFRFLTRTAVLTFFLSEGKTEPCYDYQDLLVLHT